MTVAQYLEARRGQDEWKAAFQRAFLFTDVIVTPVGPTGPSLRDDAENVTFNGNEVPLRTAMMPYTVPQNLTGLPSITCPVGLDDIRDADRDPVHGRAVERADVARPRCRARSRGHRPGRHPTPPPTAPGGTHMSHVRINPDLELHVERFGPPDAPTVILIRGTGADSSRWMPQVEAYQDEFQVVIFDNRGTGKSDTPPGPYTVAEMADDTFALLDALDIDACHVSGSSLGGAIGLQMAVARPERVLSLQMHSSWLATRGYTEYSLGLLSKILDLGGIDYYYEATLPLLFTAKFLSSDFARTSEILARMRANAASPDGLRWQIDANLSYDLSAEVGQVDVPTLITVGEHDFLLPITASQELQDNIKGSELVIFEDTAHLSGMEAPAEFNRVTLDFLRKVV